MHHSRGLDKPRDQVMRQTLYARKSFVIMVWAWTESRDSRYWVTGSMTQVRIEFQFQVLL